MNIKNIKSFLVVHYQFVGVLIASFLIAVSMGTYTNWDAQLEYEAVTSILTRGFPYVTTGLMINQPPLGFYTAAVVLVALGEPYLNCVGVATAFGLGCVVLLYVLGTLLYGKKTGLVASALFGLVPWHVYMSKIFLIDNQYLFLGLLFLIMGILAVKHNSEKLVVSAGVFFALAFLTKLYAVLMLIPLVLIVLLNRKESNFKLTARKVALFILPSIILQIIWFGVFANQNFFGVYFSSDFTHPELIANPTLEFLPIILSKSAGMFLFIALFLSLALSIIYRKKLSVFLRPDIASLGTVLIIMGLDMLLVVGFNLTVPYVSAIKYNYTALPFFCLLAASLADKSAVLINSIKRKKKDLLIPVLVGAGLVLLFSSMTENIIFLNGWTGFVAFGVDSVTYYGFNLFSEAVNRNILDALHQSALILIVTSIIIEPLFKGLKIIYNRLRPK
ncbi:MAG: glycosyltransferase family 39 protein [Candidatus Bathyarchaeia archaeon]|nr:glycosyltransferase family 39 protein [Candidatus Bathyarchaeota archaeon]MDI9577578.1 glycosyltransferase family 39 protein [Thermoproteota archaeon]